MAPYRIDATDSLDAVAWQESWDRQQEGFMPDREERFVAMLDTVEATTGGQPLRLLDLAGGPGSISLRALQRFPQAVATLVDVDPVLLAIARASFPERSTVVSSDLSASGWVDTLPHRDYDAVLTATALHWLSPERLVELFGEVHGVLRPGGVFINADHLADDGLPGLSRRLAERARARRDARWQAGAVPSWDAWWRHVAADPVLGDLLPARQAIFPDGHPEREQPPAGWHIEALRKAGFSEAGLVWRGGVDAAVAGVR